MPRLANNASRFTGDYKPHMNAPKYILSERIATGGMAEIYLGKSIGSDGFARICAFKKILPHFANDNDFINMFRNEAMLAKQLVNKNIVQVHDFVSDNDSFMLVMEYVDGQDLRAVLSLAEKSKRRIPPELACYICIEVLSGLFYAHSLVDLSGRSLGIIHRDVSPQNILMSYDGDVKITDFGIAKASSHTHSTKAGVIKGKFSYMSPEQSVGTEIDSRSDLFSVGVILFEMLTMTRLFKGEDLAVLNAVRKCDIPLPSSVNQSQVPPELERIVMRFLSKDAATRYQTGREAIKDLSKFLYSHRPDFFAGELADFMQKLFQEKIESSKARMRSTLALPFATIGPAGGGVRMTGAFEPIQNQQHPQPALFGPNAQNNRSMGSQQRQQYMQQQRRHARKKSSTNFIFVGAAAAVFLFFVFAASIKLKAVRNSAYLDLSVRNVPSVQIELDGQKLFNGNFQKTPVRIPISVNNRNILIRRPGFKPKRLDVTPGFFEREMQENLDLEKMGAHGNMRFVTTPPGAQIVVEDGLDEGRSPTIFRLLPIGRWVSISIKHPRCDALNAREFVSQQSERSVVTKTYQLRNCR